jgi:Ca-activated chloride channel family protein
VSFAEPWRLLLVVVPLATLVAYVLVQRSRQKYAVRFTSVDLLASVAPRRPGWQRHVAALLMLASLSVLVVGFAEPSRNVRVAKNQGTILLAIDTSGSMAATDVRPTRLATAQTAARNFVKKLPKALKVGLLAFDSTARVVVSPVSDRNPVLDGIDALQVGGATATASAITQALDAVKSLPKAKNGKQPSAALVLMSDGTPTVGENGLDPQASVQAATAAAKQAGVPIDTIAFGTASGTLQQNGETVPVPADPAAMAAIAKGSGGKSFTAKDVNQLNSVYGQIRLSLGFETHHSDITIWFLGFGLALLMLMAAASLFWMQRIP